LIANSAMARAAASVNICAASDSRARLLNTRPPMTSTIRKVPVSARAMVSCRALAPAVWS